MTNNTIITIGRQFGSGGHEIGNRLSERLGIPLYDYNLIRMAAQELKIDPQKAQEVDETILGRYMASAVSGAEAPKILIPSSTCGIFVAGTEDRRLDEYLQRAAELAVRELSP